MKAEEFSDLVYKESKKDYGLCPPPISAEKGLKILMNHFLGDDWYVVMPLGREQVYTEAIFEILNRNQKRESFLQKIVGRVLSMICNNGGSRVMKFIRQIYLRLCKKAICGNCIHYTQTGETAAPACKPDASVEEWEKRKEKLRRK